MNNTHNKRMQPDKMDATRHFAADARRYVTLKLLNEQW